MAFKNSILITGGTSGLGFETALILAEQNPSALIIIASRNHNGASTKINQTLKQSNTIFLPLDLSSLSNTRSFAEEFIAANHPPLKSLILNAALQFPDEIRYTEDGIESTFAIAHVGHALLFHLLCPILPPGTRIVVVSSGVHNPAINTGMPDAIYTSAAALAHPTAEMEKCDGRQRYCSSKLANVLWTYALDRRFRNLRGGNRLTVVAFNPGLMPGTQLGREYRSQVLRFLWFYVLPYVTPLLRLVLGTTDIHRVEESGANLAYLAASEEVEGVSGVYFSARKPELSSADSHVEAKQEDLWRWTLENVANEEERKAGSFEIV